METEVAVDDAAATEEAASADDPAGEEAARAAAAAADEGSGDRTDDPEAAGATGATPTADPPAAAGAPGSEEPQPGVYLKAGDGVFINIPWASTSRAPVDGESFDVEVLASAGLTLVDAPSSSNDEPEGGAAAAEAGVALPCSPGQAGVPRSACRKGGGGSGE